MKNIELEEFNMSLCSKKPNIDGDQTGEGEYMVDGDNDGPGDAATKEGDKGKDKDEK